MLLVWCMCVCVLCMVFFIAINGDWRWKYVGFFFCLARALTLNEVLLILLAMIPTSGAISILWCRVKKSMCKKTFSSSNRHFSCCFSSTVFSSRSLHFYFYYYYLPAISSRSVFLSLCQFFCCFVFFVSFQTLARVICCLVLFVICCHRKNVLWILWLLKCRQQ